LCTVAAPRAEEVAPVPGAETAAEPAEPELIRKPKPEEEGEGEAEAPAKGAAAKAAPAKAEKAEKEKKG
jgi:hypothetical protein